MKLPTILLAAVTAASFIASLVTGRAAKSLADDAIGFSSVNSEKLQQATSAAAASNIWLTLAGVGVIALLVVWANWAQRQAS